MCVLGHIEGLSTYLTFSVKQAEEDATIGRTDYTPSDFHVVHSNINYMIGLSKPANVCSDVTVPNIGYVFVACGESPKTP